MNDQKFKPMTPIELAQELGVSLSQRGQPRLRDEVPKRFISREEAEARGLSLYWQGAACRAGHQAARSVANDGCMDCVRMREGKDPIYPKSKAQEYRSATKTTNAEKAAAPVVIQQPAAPELTAADLKLLAKLDELRDFDAAAKAAGTSRGLIEARASSYPLFRTALDDLCQRRDIPWTRAADPKTFVWTDAIERQLVKRYIDTGLIEQARNELGIAASDYQQHLQDSADFVGLIDAARPAARETLRERAMHAAAIGNDRLAKLLEDEGDGLITLVGGQRVHPLGNPDAMRAALEDILRDARKRLDAQERVRAACDARVAADAARKPAKPTDEDLTT